MTVGILEFSVAVRIVSYMESNLFEYFFVRIVENYRRMEFATFKFVYLFESVLCSGVRNGADRKRDESFVRMEFFAVAAEMIYLQVYNRF